MAMQISIDVDEHINTLDALRARAREAKAYTRVSSVAYEEMDAVSRILSEMIDRCVKARSRADR